MSAMREILLVALGGGVGAALRGAIDLLAARVGLAAPPATLAINLIGSFAAGLLVALVAWGFGVGVFDATPSVELWLLCWAGGAAFVLLVQEGPI